MERTERKSSEKSDLRDGATWKMRRYISMAISFEFALNVGSEDTTRLSVESANFGVSEDGGAFLRRELRMKRLAILRLGQGEGRGIQMSVGNDTDLYSCGQLG